MSETAEIRLAKMAAIESNKTTAGEIVDPEPQAVSTVDSCELGAHSSALSFATTAGSSGDKEPRCKDGINHPLVADTRGSEAFVADISDGDDKWRFQLRLENGHFTDALKDALFRDLNTCLYSSPSSTFIPSFRGSGLRFGIVWFSPDNEESYNWVVDKLTAINDKAGKNRFIIEPYSAHQNKICVNLPWDAQEGLRGENVLIRLKFQNPRIPVDHWRVIKIQPTHSGNQLLMCCIDDASLKLLENQKFRLNYGFQKVQVDVLPQKRTTKKNTK